MKKENRGILDMIICAVLWSLGGIFMKMLPWNGFALASLRSLIAGITILAYILIKKYKFIINRKTLVSGILTAFVYICFVCANKLTTSANAIVLQFTSPVFIVIFSAIFFRQKIKKADLITVIITLCGIALFFLDTLEGGYILGNCVAILAGMFMASMYMSVGNLEGEAKFSAITLGQFFTFLIGLPMVIITRPEINMSSFSSIMILGVFQLGIAYVLYIKASKYCPPLACCLLGVIEPLLNPVWVMLFDGETPGVFALIGGIIVIVTVTIWCAFFRESGEQAA